MIHFIDIYLFIIYYSSHTHIIKSENVDSIDAMITTNYSMNGVKCFKTWIV
jgi:hypothetical protein